LLLENKGNETVRNEIVKHLRKEFAGKRKEASELKVLVGLHQEKLQKPKQANKEKVVD
jgi:hypothetical protein